MRRILQKTPSCIEQHQLEELAVHPPSSSSNLPKQGQQWPGRQQHVPGRQWRDGWWIAKVVIRSISFLLASILLGLELGVGKHYPPFNDVSADFIACVTVAGAILLWDASEFVTLCCRRGYGITSKAHIGLDLTLALGSAAAVTLVCLNIGLNDYYYLYSSDFMSAELAVNALLSLVHFVLCFRNCIDRRRGIGISPRIMYLPTGEPVVVIPRPFPPKPSNQETRREAFSLRVAHRERPRIDQIAKAVLPQAPSTPAAYAIPEPDLIPVQPYEETAQEYSVNRPLAVIPKRKPVPLRGTPFSSPWAAPAPDYVPDEAERARAARGESQAQRMSTLGMEIIGRGKRPRELTPRLTGTDSRYDEPAEVV